MMLRHIKRLITAVLDSVRTKVAPRRRVRDSIPRKSAFYFDKTGLRPVATASTDKKNNSCRLCRL